MCLNVWHRLTCESFIWLKVNSSLQIIWMISLFFILIINYYVFMMLLFLLDIYEPTNIVDVWEFILFPLSGKKDQLVLCYTLAERLTSVWSRGHKCCIFYSLLAVMSSNNCVRSFNSWPLFYCRPFTRCHRVWVQVKWAPNKDVTMIMNQALRLSFDVYSVTYNSS